VAVVNKLLLSKRLFMRVRRLKSCVCYRHAVLISSVFMESVLMLHEQNGGCFCDMK